MWKLCYIFQCRLGNHSKLYFYRMKIRRIDQKGILDHARNHERKFHRATVSQIISFGDYAGGVNKFQRSLVQGKVAKQRLLAIKQQKRQNQVPNQQSMKILPIYQKIKFLYHKLSQLYSTNQNKLTSLLVRHIKVEYYIFSKQLLEMIKNFRIKRENISICQHSQPLKIINEMSKFKEYLEKFYEKKCLKQIQIIQDNILQRQQAIRYDTPFEKYKRITQSFRPSLITNNVDIVEEFKLMSQQNGGFRELSNVQNSLFRKLRDTEHRIAKVFVSVCTSKEKDQFMCRIQGIS